MKPYPHPWVWPEVMKTHGWNKRAIQTFLGDADRLEPNPHRRRSTMRLYNVERCLAAERAAEFHEWLVQQTERRHAGLEDSREGFQESDPLYAQLKDALQAVLGALDRL